MGKFNKLTRVIKLVNEYSIIYMELFETFLSLKNHRKNYRRGVYWNFDASPHMNWAPLNKDPIKG